MECCLAGFEMSQPDQELADKLFNIINEKTLTMQVLEVMKSQTLIVDLLDENNVNIASYLKPSPISAPPRTAAQIQIAPTPPVVASGDDGMCISIFIFSRQ